MKKRATKRQTKKTTRPKAKRVRAKPSRPAARNASPDERRRTEIAYLASIVEYSQDGMVRCSPDAIIQSWNVGAQRLFGYTPGEVIGKRISILAPHDRRAEPKRTHEALTRGEEVPPYETFRKRKDGSLVEVEVSVTNIMDGNRRIATAAAYRDISKRKRAEEALRMSEERYALVEAATKDGVWDWNPMTRQSYHSPRLQAMLGFAKNEIPDIGEDWSSRIHPDDASRVQEALRLHLEKGTSFDVELRLRRKDGSYGWFNARGEAIRDGTGRAIRMVGSSADITERKNAEGALRVSEERYALVEAATNDGVWDWNPATHEVYLSPRWKALLGFGEDELEDKDHSFFSRIHADDVATVQDTIRRHFEEHAPYDLELRLRCKDGSYRWFNTRGQALRDQTGRVIRMLGAITDITVRKRAEEALQQSERELRKLAADLSNERTRLAEAQAVAKMGSWELDLRTSVLMWSDETYRIFGLDPATRSVTRKAFRETVHPDDREAVRSAYDKSVADHTPFEVVHRLLLRDGSIKIVREHCQTLYDKRGKPLRSVGAVQDITESTRAEQALQQSYDVLAKVFRQVPGVIFQFQLFPDGRSCVPFASDQLHELYEVAPEDIRNDATAVLSIVHPDDYEAFITSIQESARTLEPWHCEYRVVLPKQGVRWRMGDSRPERLGDGSTLWHGFITDITERQRSEAALAESERRLKEAQSLGEIGDWQFAVRTGEISWSEALFQLFEREPAKGPPDFEENMAYYFPEDSLRLQECIRRAIETGEGYEIDLHLRLPSGRDTWHHAVAKVVKDRLGKVAKLYGTAQDITGRKQGEDALRELNALLEKRVALRTASLLSSTDSLLRSSTALRKEKDERRRLEEEIIEISEAERRRIGHDLHDDLGQQLAGLSWLSSVLEKNLAAQSSPEAGSAARIAELLGGALNLTRNLARGLQPVPIESGGLMAALSGLAARTSELFKVECELDCHQPVHLRNPTAATHLYRIAQEAVTNAVRHGHAKQIQITLSSARGKLHLSVAGDGNGWKKPAEGHEGLGVRIMRYRAETLRGSLKFQKNPGGGIRVICHIPIPADSPDDHGKAG